MATKEEMQTEIRELVAHSSLSARQEWEDDWDAWEAELAARRRAKRKAKARLLPLEQTAGADAVEMILPGLGNKLPDFVVLYRQSPHQFGKALAKALAAMETA